jgi:hypothetical protein
VVWIFSHNICLLAHVGLCRPVYGANDTIANRSGRTPHIRPANFKL